MRANLPMGKPRTPAIFTSPQDAAQAFYQAFEAKDVDAMMATWADDEEIVCVHPGGARLVGYEAVRASWERIFSGGRWSFRDDNAGLQTIHHLGAGRIVRAGRVIQARAR